MSDEPTKCILQLYIDSELKKIAKSSGVNLSKEFEEWLRIRLNQENKVNESFDYDKEYAKIRMEMQKLESKKELRTRQEFKEKERIMVLDNLLDAMIKTEKMENDSSIIMDDKTTREQKLEKASYGLKFLFKQKFNEDMTESQAKELLTNRIKERGL